MAKATWNGKTIAETDRAIQVEGNLYFPPDCVKKNCMKKSNREYVCPWKGIASYYDLEIEGKTNKDAAWCYHAVTREANPIKNYVAFDRALGVKVEGIGIDTIEPPD